jgi:kinesin family protein 2/24
MNVKHNFQPVYLGSLLGLAAKQFQRQSASHTGPDCWLPVLVLRICTMASRSPRKGNRDKTAARIDEIAERRELRRLAQEQHKVQRERQVARNQAQGRGGDVDFQRLIEDWRYTQGTDQLPHIASTNVKINIVARKRPIGSKEVERCDYDSVSVLNPQVVVHYPKMKVDGITKYLENQTFQFDHVRVGCY